MKSESCLGSVGHNAGNCPGNDQSASSVSVFQRFADRYCRDNSQNFAKEASTGSSNVGYTLHFARTADIFNDFPNHTGIAVSFSSANLNASLATSLLANGLQQDGRDVAIFAFARNGAGLNFNTGPDGNDWEWYPGDDPEQGEFYNGSLYANFVNWTQTRLQELINAGHTPTVKGLFWFQGEKDGRLGDHDVYGENFDNLVFRFRQDYGNNLLIVATQIRLVTETAANRLVINNTLETAANMDPLIGYVLTEDLEFRSATDVHLSSNGHAALAPRWSDAILNLQANIVATGDINGDGTIDLLDVGPFVELLQMGTFSEQADINGDGVVDLLDIGPFVELLTGP